MARLTDDQKRELPPPPAPPRRSANPWTLSETARKPEPRPESSTRNILDELIKQAPTEDSHAEQEVPPPPAGAVRPRPKPWFLVIAVVAVVIVLRVLLESRKDSDWAGMIGPLVVIAFIAHGWWKMRQRREANKTKRD